MPRIIEGVRSFELQRNLALMYASEQYRQAPPRVEASSSPSSNICACVAPLNRTTIRWFFLHPNSPTKYRTNPRQLPRQRKTYNKHRSATSSKSTATSESTFQLRRPIALRNRLPAKRLRSKTSAMAGKFLSHEPIRKMDLPVTAAWKKSRGFPGITTSARNRGLLHHMRPH